MSVIQLFIQVLTITMSGVVAAVVTSKINTSRDEQQFRRKKLEDLYDAFAGFCMTLEVTWHRYMSVMAGKLTYNDALDLEIKAGVEESHFQRLEMLVSIYWLEFDSYLNELKRLRDDGAGILTTHKLRYDQGRIEDRESLHQMQQVAIELDGIRCKFQAAVRNTGERLQ